MPIRYAAILLTFLLGPVAAADVVYPPGTSPEAIVESLRLEGIAGYDGVLRKVHNPYSDDVWGQLVRAAAGPVPFLRTTSLFLILQMIKQTEVPAGAIRKIRPVCIWLVSLTDQNDGNEWSASVAKQLALQRQLADRILWHLPLIRVKDADTRAELLRAALEREGSDREHYAWEAIGYLAEMGPAGREVLDKKLAEEGVSSQLKRRLEYGLEKLEIREELKQLGAKQRVEFLEALFSKALVGHGKVLEHGGEEGFLRRDRLEWQLEVIGAILDASSRDLLMRTALNEDYDKVVRLKAEAILVERGGLDHRYEIVPPVL